MISDLPASGVSVLVIAILPMTLHNFDLAAPLALLTELVQTIRYVFSHLALSAKKRPAEAGKTVRKITAYQDERC
jgi:hypothetical protein